MAYSILIESRQQFVGRIAWPLRGGTQLEGQEAGMREGRTARHSRLAELFIFAVIARGNVLLCPGWFIHD
ncbi:MAG: hypothetical protein DRQ48_11955 [Gammaproteobacteria bacterium]|nr:MAG: hypothetical protein DRQ48_11955 [Gammaproteobacteria bacterium]